MKRITLNTDEVLVLDPSHIVVVTSDENDGETMMMNGTDILNEFREDEVPNGTLAGVLDWYLAHIGGNHREIIVLKDGILCNAMLTD